MATVTYSSNNSGGSWWLTDDDWHALAAAGWKVKWVGEDKRWLGALAIDAVREGLTLREAVEEWETITGQDASALGCTCCGPPHSFYDENGDTPPVVHESRIDW